MDTEKYKEYMHRLERRTADYYEELHNISRNNSTIRKFNDYILDKKLPDGESLDDLLTQADALTKNQWGQTLSDRHLFLVAKKYN